MKQAVTFLRNIANGAASARMQAGRSGEDLVIPAKRAFSGSTIPIINFSYRAFSGANLSNYRILLHPISSLNETST